jgi:hypothetical protein
MPTFSLDEIKNADGKQGRPMYFSLNGKVRQYLKNDPVSLGRYEVMRKNYGPHIEFFYASGLYDPKYGLPS